MILRVFPLVLCICAGSLGAQSSGIDTSAIDRTIRPQDDFYRYVNGRWLDRTDSASSRNRSRDAQLRVYDEMRSLLASPAFVAESRNADRRKLSDLYRSIMDEQTIESAGMSPLRGDLKRIEEIRSTLDVTRILALLARSGVSVPVAVSVHPDQREPTKYLADLEQSGLSLPDRDYYLSPEPRFVELRAAYVAHVTRVLALAGDAAAESEASTILSFETALATAQWTSVENRDPVKTYNRIALGAVERLAPGLHGTRFLTELGLVGRTPYVNISEPTYFSALGKLVQDTPLPVWRAYLRWSVINHYSPFLSARFGQEQVAFSRLLGGEASSRPRWLRAVGFVDDRMGDALGRAYVEQYFTPGTKARSDTLIRNLIGTFQRRIEALDWMSADTKREAQAKLATLTVKLGQPKRAMDYTSLRTSSTDLVGNIAHARLFRYDRDLDRLGKPIDRDEWAMSALAVNGSYSAVRNEIVLPAALIQPPYFQSDADDAANYGGLGWFIAHELSHAFDNRGNQYDSRGTLRDWWTPADHAQFAQRSAALVAQYSRYEPVTGLHINGALTVGENLADNLGLSIAYEAYHHSLGGRVAPVLDGLTGDQRFYMSFATIWAGKDTDANLVRMIKSDTHSPAPFRVLGTLVNQDPFYAAFNIHDGDRMYVPPAQRVRIW